MGRKGSGSGLSGIKLLAVTVKHMLQWRQILLLPITMFIGSEQAFIAVDFTAVSKLIYIYISNNLFSKWMCAVICCVRLGNFTHWLRHDLFWHCQCNCGCFCGRSCQMDGSISDDGGHNGVTRCSDTVHALVASGWLGLCGVLYDGRTMGIGRWYLAGASEL